MPATINTWTGRTLAGRYVIAQPLGSGAAADVYAARDTQLQRQVAVKLLRPAAAADPAVRAGFQHEAELAAGLHHPHLARVYDAGTEDGVPYLVMERVDGRPVATDQPLEVGRAVDMITQVAGALAFVQDQGLVHYDIKPANILVDPAGEAKLVDFGVARNTDRAAPADPGDSATRLLPVLAASPEALPYLAPEVLAGAAPGPAAGVYSLGAVLYTLLAGRPPYRGRTAPELAQARAAGAPPPLRQLNPAVPPALEALVDRALAPDPGARYPSAAAMETALRTLQAGSREATAAMAGAPPAPAGPIAPFLPAETPPGAAATEPAPLAVTPSPSRPAQAAGRPFLPGAAPDAPTAPVVAPGRTAAAGAMPRWVLPVLAGVLLLGLLAWVLSQAGRGAPATRVAAGPPATTPAGPPATPAALAVPDLRGLALDQAQAAAQQGGWTLVAAPGVNTDAVAPGLIMDQQPAAGTSLAPGAPITVTASLGPAATAPPPDQPTAAVTNGDPVPPPRTGGQPGQGQGNTAPGGQGKGKGKDKGKGDH